MGWITERCHRTGHSIGGRTGKHKGPLRKIVGYYSHATNLFDFDHVKLECGHDGRSYGGQRARCRECGKGDPKYDRSIASQSTAGKAPASLDSQENIPKDSEESYCDWLRERDRIENERQEEERAMNEQALLQRLTDG
jgi:hypothetical protein